MTSIVGFPLGTLYQITNITNGFPGVVTLSTVADPNSFAVANGQTVTIDRVSGMYEVNKNRYIVGSFDSVAKTFKLYDLRFLPVDTTQFNTYVSGGEMNIFSYAATAGNPPGLMFNNQ